MRVKRQQPRIVLEDGKPSAVIIPIDEYRELLERLEDLEDLQALEEMRRELSFRSLDECLAEHDQRVPGPSRKKG